MQSTHVYLISLYLNLENNIKGRNLWKIYQSRLSKLLSPENYKINVEKFLKKAGLADASEKTKEKYSHFLMLREDCAQYFNIPRGRCASDQQLVKFFNDLPQNEPELSKALIERNHMTKPPFKTKLIELCSGLKKI